MNRSSCNIADIMMTHKILNLEKSGKIRGNLYLHWKVKWTTTTKRIYPQEISFNCLSSKRMEKISTCVLPSIKDHHFIFHSWNQGWDHIVGWFEIAELCLSQLFFSDWILPIFSSVNSLGENVVYFKKA